MAGNTKEQLSENFTLEEMTFSATAKSLKISNAPTATHKKTLKHTCVYLLEPLRKLLTEKYGPCSVNITSGYRSANLNAKIPNSSKTSQHLTGEAADFKVIIKKTNTILDYTKLYEDIKVWVKAGKLSVDQCILETSGGVWWVHASHSASGKTKDRKQFLKYRNGTYFLDCDL